MLRTMIAVPFAFLFVAAHAFAQALDPASSGDATAPVTVKVATLEVVEVGATKGDPNARFGIVNAKQTPCYAFAPPGGATVEVGSSYTVIPATNVDETLRTKIGSDYPTCGLVYVVGRSVR